MRAPCPVRKRQFISGRPRLQRSIVEPDRDLDFADNIQDQADRERDPATKALLETCFPEREVPGRICHAAGVQAKS